MPFCILIKEKEQNQKLEELKLEAFQLNHHKAEDVLKIMIKPMTKRKPRLKSSSKEERDMISGVLTLADRSIRSVMTPRNEISRARPTPSDTGFFVTED